MRRQKHGALGPAAAPVVPRAYSARTHLAAFGLCLALPLLAALAGFVFSSIQQERLLTERRLIQVLNDLTDNLERDLDRHLTLLNTLATSSFLQEQNWSAFHAQAKNALRGRSYLVLSDMTGQQVLNTYVAYGAQPLMTGDPETLRRIAETRQPVFSNLFTSKVVHRPVLNVSVPVFRGADPAYIMSLGLLPEDLSKILSGLHLDADWVTTVWDAHGAVIARSRGLDRFLGVIVPADLRGQNESRAAFRANNLDGEPVLRAVAVSKLSGWGVAVNVSAKAVDRQLFSAVGWLAATMLLTVLAAVVLALSMSRVLTGALADTAAAASALGRNERPHARPSRVTELNDVNRALEGAHRDIAHDRAALAESDAQKTTIMRELNHRMKNTLTLVQSIAELTIASFAPREVTGAFYARLKALAVSGDVLAKGNWDDADLRQIVENAVAPHHNPAVIDVVGPEIRIPAKAAGALALAFHELCTNATKYGALSSVGGRITIAWTFHPDSAQSRVKLRWQEAHGPPVIAPTHEGFGTVLITDAVAHALGGSVELVYPPDGVVCTMDFPTG